MQCHVYSISIESVSLFLVYRQSIVMKPCNMGWIYKLSLGYGHHDHGLVSFYFETLIVESTGI